MCAKITRTETMSHVPKGLGDALSVEPETRSLLAVRVEHVRDFLEAEVVGIDLGMAREVGFKAKHECIVGIGNLQRGLGLGVTLYCGGRPGKW